MQTMDRKEFLSLLGVSALGFVVTQCLSACQPDLTYPSAPTNVNFSIDLTSPANAALQSNGGYVYQNGIVIARTVHGTYVAVSQYCTHAGGTVAYHSNSDDFYCPVHGSAFSDTGAVIQGPASAPLVKYNTSQTGSTLTVYS